MNKIIEIAKCIKDNGGTAYYVGGYVRDKYWGIESNDIDIEVFDIPQSDLERILEPFGAKYEGKAFGVYMIDEIEIALPRRFEIKVGNKHTDFVVEIDHRLSLQEAALRRDFTINTGMIEVLGGEFIFPIGDDDLCRKRLHPTSCAFMEDPLRVMRGFRFISRYGLSPSKLTVNYSYAIKDLFVSISSERVWAEWWKWSKGLYTTQSLRFLQRTGWLKHFPELDNLVGLPQDPKWHPEGDVWIHTQMTCNRIAGRLWVSNCRSPALMFAALLHDTGKADTTEYPIKKGERITSYGHAEAGLEHVDTFLKHGPKALHDHVADLVAEHMVALNPPTKRTARRLLSRLKIATWQELQYLIIADHSARPPLSVREPENSKKLFAYCKEVEDYIQPILQGRHLIEMGFEPGPKFGPILKSTYEWQLDGAITNIDEAVAYVKREAGGYGLERKEG